MRNLLRKEMTLSASILSYLFIVFGLMFFIPGYPILCGVFFVTLGIYQSFQNTRETNDILFSALLPVAKSDVVKAKFLFVCLIELCAFLLMTTSTVIRMTLLADSAAYLANELMNANPFALGLALIIFALFNTIFLGGFFKTAYRIGKPFLLYIIAAFTVVALGETLHHLPRLGFLNAFAAEHHAFQITALLAGGVLYALITLLSYRTACRRFEGIDL